MPETSGYPPLNIPIPDPSAITEREINKAKADLRREFEIKLDGLAQNLDTRRDGYVSLFEARLDGAVHRLDEKIASVVVKFEGVDLRLLERDRRFDSTLVAYRDAANAQIVSTANAAVKIEASFTKEVDSIKTLIGAMKEGFNADVSNLKGRMDRGEAGSQGARTQAEDRRANTTQATTIVAGIVGFLVLLVAIAGLWASTHPVRSLPEVVAGQPFTVGPPLPQQQRWDSR